MATIYRGFIRAHQRGCSRDYQNAYLKQCASGMDMEYKGYVDIENLVSDIASGDIVGVYSLDRFSRNQVELQDIMDLIRSKGGIIHSGGTEIKDDRAEDVFFGRLAIA